MLRTRGKKSAMTTAALAIEYGWEMQSPGWWTRPDQPAGICRESDGQWWLYLDDSAPMSGNAKPFKSQKEAIVDLLREPVNKITDYISEKVI